MYGASSVVASLAEDSKVIVPQRVGGVWSLSKRGQWSGDGVSELPDPAVDAAV